MEAMERMLRTRTGGGEVAFAVAAAARRVHQARGRLRESRRLLDSSLVPMSMLDSERRCVEVNTAARLLFRQARAEIRGRRADELLSTGGGRNVESTWRELMKTGSAHGRYDVEFADRGRLEIDYAALANILPGLHLVVFLPAGWPAHELPCVPAEEPAHADRTLSPRQKEILALIAAGAETPRIAAELSLSEATVKTHVRDAIRRLRARNRTHAVALAMAAGLIAPTAAVTPLPEARNGARTDVALGLSGR